MASVSLATASIASAAYAGRHASNGAWMSKMMLRPEDDLGVSQLCGLGRRGGIGGCGNYPWWEVL